MDDDNQILYRYSDVAGEEFRKNQDNNDLETWVIDLANLNHSAGGVGTPIPATKPKLIRNPATANIRTDSTGTNQYTLNIAEIKIEGYEASATNSGMFIPPPYLITLNEGASHSLEKYVVDVKGAFSNNNIFLF